MLVDGATGNVEWSRVSPRDDCSTTTMTGPIDDYGYAVALSDRFASVSAPVLGTVWVYDGAGSLLREIEASDDGSVGFGLALAAEAEYLAVSAGTGDVHVFDASTGEAIWTTRVEDVPPGGEWTGGPALAMAGGVLFVGGAYSERLHAFDVLSGQRLWERSLRFGSDAPTRRQAATPKAGLIGWGVALAADTRHVVTTGTDATRWAAYRLDARTGIVKRRYRGEDGFGGYQSIAMSAGLVAVGFTNIGANEEPARVYLYRRGSGRRVQEFRYDFGAAFGKSVGLLGSKALFIGVPERDSVQVFERRQRGN